VRGRGWSGGHAGQSDVGIFAYGSETFKAHAAAADDPLVILFEHESADEADDGVVVRNSHEPGRTGRRIGVAIGKCAAGEAVA